LIVFDDNFEVLQPLGGVEEIVLLLEKLCGGPKRLIMALKGEHATREAFILDKLQEEWETYCRDCGAELCSLWL
jgi:hypothetical protein